MPLSKVKMSFYQKSSLRTCHWRSQAPFLTKNRRLKMSFSKKQLSFRFVEVHLKSNSSLKNLFSQVAVLILAFHREMSDVKALPSSASRSCLRHWLWLRRLPVLCFSSFSSRLSRSLFLTSSSHFLEPGMYRLEL